MVFDDNQILPRAASSGHGALPARPQGGQFQHLFRERQQRGNFAVPQTIYIQAPAQAPVPPPTPGASRLVDPNIEYPRIDSWLLDLDLHPKRGAENLNFAQYAPYFEAGAYKTIVQLEDLTMAEYKEYVSQAIPGGVISAIKKYVKEDIILLKRAAANRASQILGY
ncbi:hypothetical protein SISSUDRAFT_1056416 [Sistotremastrum suecicum HHB10207 ss-3]|uniref:Uncharacterized protein n=1 Tax=Sistotremastrum suecicum HHB10207 ss-3 TaxID=1314776 RepID=A0A165WWW3_9AGAM|nr:hypothetical protein SISSUDRAFT_1056416 [Sistotremastrum suecicum HHB10207 ss-3]